MKEKAVINQNALKRYVWIHVGALAAAILRAKNNGTALVCLGSLYMYKEISEKI